MLHSCMKNALIYRTDAANQRKVSIYFETPLNADEFMRQLDEHVRPSDQVTINDNGFRLRRESEVGASRLRRALERVHDRQHTHDFYGWQFEDCVRSGVDYSGHAHDFYGWNPVITWDRQELGVGWLYRHEALHGLIRNGLKPSMHGFYGWIDRESDV